MIVLFEVFGKIGEDFFKVLRLEGYNCFKFLKVDFKGIFGYRWNVVSCRRIYFW